MFVCSVAIPATVSPSCLYGLAAWRLEPEGETEMPETSVTSDGVEGFYVDFDGEGHHERGQIQNSMTQSDVPGEEGEEIKSPKRKIIRVESEETTDYVREANDHRIM